MQTVWWSIVAWQTSSGYCIISNEAVSSFDLITGYGQPNEGSNFMSQDRTEEHGNMDVGQGSMGQMASGTFSSGDGYGESGFEEEAPLLLELGIDFELIKQKVWEFDILC